jgi:hypothetical protein
MSNEWVMVPREPTANQLVDGAYEVPDPISHRGELTARMVYRAMLDAAPQQAEPVSYAVFDPSGEVVYAALYKIRCVEYADNEYRYGHSAAKNWVVRPVFAHPPAAEVQRLREALKPFAAIDLTTNQAVDAMDVLRARRALEGQ